MSKKSKAEAKAKELEVKGVEEVKGPTITEEIQSGEVQGESERFPFEEEKVIVGSADIVTLDSLSGPSVTLCLTALKDSQNVLTLVQYCNGKTSAKEASRVLSKCLMEIKIIK